MAHSYRRFLLLALLCGSAAGILWSCSSPAGPEPVPCTQTPLFSASRVLPANSQDAASFTTPATGRLDLTVDWVPGSTIMGVVLAQAPCSLDQLQNGNCNVYFSMFSPPKPITDSTSLLRAGTYTLIVSNPNPIPESVSATVVLTSAGCS